MPTGTTPQQEAAHKAAIAAQGNARQQAIANAKAAFNNTPAQQPAFDAAVKAADIAYVRGLIASAAANGLEGPRETLRQLTGSAE